RLVGIEDVVGDLDPRLRGEVGDGFLADVVRPVVEIDRALGSGLRRSRLGGLVGGGRLLATAGSDGQGGENTQEQTGLAHLELLSTTSVEDVTWSSSLGDLPIIAANGNEGSAGANPVGAVHAALSPA